MSVIEYRKKAREIICLEADLMAALEWGIIRSPKQNLNLFFKAFQSLKPGGRTIIRDHVMKPDRTGPKDGAVFAINILVSTPGGNTYPSDEIRTGLTPAGFINVRLLQEGEQMDGLVEAVRP